MKITPEENKLLRELIEQYDYPCLDPEKHVTAEVLGKQLNITHRAALYRLERLRDQGRLDREKVRLDDGKIVYGYFNKLK
jgi:predicted transcriptional regulator